MSITVKLPQTLRGTAGGVTSVRVDTPRETTLAGLLDELAGSHPALERRLRDETRTLRRYVNFYIDGEECRALNGPATPLRDGDEVRVVPSVAGG